MWCACEMKHLWPSGAALRGEAQITSSGIS